MPRMDADRKALRPEDYETLVELALREDHVEDDLTSAVLPGDDRTATGEMIVKAPGVVCGLDVACAVFRRLDPTVELERLADDGDTVGAGTVVLRARGDARALLRGERTALNFMQRLSGIATLTASFVEQAMATRAGVYDTRKTTPGWRALEKYAVRCGGGHNHRMDLADAAMIKENHLVAAYGGTGPEAIARGLRALLDTLAAGVRIYVEVESEAELDAALEAAGKEVGRLVLMLDDFELGAIRAAVRRVQTLRAPRPRLEITGGVTVERLEGLASTGVGRISSGALTHSARALDISFKLRP